MLVDIGWLHGYDVIEIDPSKGSAIIEGESALAQLAGQSLEPICKPLCLALETIGSRAFAMPISVVEKKCICQGGGKCRFVFSPRPTQR